MRSPEPLLRTLALLLAAGAVLIAAATLARAPQIAPVPQDFEVAGPHRQTLQRCRALNPEALATDRACQRAWAAHRDRFLGVSPDPDAED